MIDSPWPAPAKINLFLHIIGRRQDGYHQLQTLFQFLDLQDDLWFEIREDDVIQRCTEIKSVPQEEDLIIRAARRLRDAARSKAILVLDQKELGVDIHIDKRLPMGGGIGGGSSNAATTLVALNKLWGLNFTSQELAEVGIQLGADIPVFIYGQSAWAEGVGEILQPFTPEMPWYLLVHPGVHISTATIFSHKELTRDTTPIKMHTFVAGDGHNDCESVVRECYPEVDQVFEWFGSQGLGHGMDKHARLTGTGACVFCPYGSEKDAEKAARELPDEWSAYVAKGLNCSPLLERLAKEP